MKKDSYEDNKCMLSNPLELNSRWVEIIFSFVDPKTGKNNISSVSFLAHLVGYVQSVAKTEHVDLWFNMGDNAPALGDFWVRASVAKVSTITMVGMPSWRKST